MDPPLWILDWSGFTSPTYRLFIIFSSHGTGYPSSCSPAFIMFSRAGIFHYKAIETEAGSGAGCRITAHGRHPANLACFPTPSTRRKRPFCPFFITKGKILYFQHTWCIITGSCFKIIFWPNLGVELSFQTFDLLLVCLRVETRSRLDIDPNPLFEMASTRLLSFPPLLFILKLRNGAYDLAGMG